jgi:mono/diheme cytochrome c family protein
LIVLLLGLLIGTAVVFGLLAVGIWRKQQGITRWPGTVAAGLTACACAATASIGLIGVYRLDAARQTTAAPVTLSSAPDRLERGEHLAYLCVRCHSASDTLPLSGGTKNFLASPDRSLGELYAPNLTPKGPLGTWSDSEIVRATREGVDNAGRALLAHPANDYHVMSDADVDALDDYLHTQQPVLSQTPAKNVSLVGMVLIGAGQYPVEVQPPVLNVMPAAASGRTPEHGSYLVTISGCGDCHGANLTGGPLGFPPNLIAIARDWSADEFVHTLRTGKNR